MKQKTYHVICFLLGALFLASGFGKAMNAGRFGNLIAQYGFAWLQNTAPLIILAEILAGICLILHLRTKWMSLASLVMLVGFSIAYGYGYFVNNISDCGCFGSLNVGISGPLFTFSRNAVLIVFSIFIWKNTPDIKNKINIVNWKMAITGILLLPLIFLTGYTFRTPEAFWERKATHPWINMSVRETPVQEHITLSKDSTYLLLFLSYDCFHCWNSVANFQQIRNSGMVDRAMAFAQTDDTTRMKTGLFQTEREQFIQSFGNDIIASEIGYADAIREHITRRPTFLYIKNDTVRVVVEGELPSALTFRKMYINELF